MTNALAAINAIKSRIRLVPNFPTEGVTFYDITPVVEDAEMFRGIIDGLAELVREFRPDKVVGIDARGFLFASPVAYLLNAGLVLVRKKGKLPYDVIREYHELEYGRTAMELHVDTVKKDERIVIIDDVLATGGTAGASLNMVKQLGGNVLAFGFLLEIEKFRGKEKLAPVPVRSLVTF